VEFIFCKAKITAALSRFINLTLLVISRTPRSMVRVKAGSARKGAMKSFSSARVSVGSIDYRQSSTRPVYDRARRGLSRVWLCVKLVTKVSWWQRIGWRSWNYRAELANAVLWDWYCQHERWRAMVYWS